MRQTLVSALVACAESPLQSAVQRFLLGLSFDELQFIADYRGTCILESCEANPAGAARRIAGFERHATCGSPEDRDHKMILLREYLRRCGVPSESARLGAA